MRYVDYERDVYNRYDGLMAAAYEKANIWPRGDAEDGVIILWEEVQEAFEAMDSLLTVAQADAGIDHGKTPNDKQLGDIRGVAITTIFELLQVIAVCNKYQFVFSREQEKDND